MAEKITVGKKIVFSSAVQVSLGVVLGLACAYNLALIGSSTRGLIEGSMPGLYHISIVGSEFKDLQNHLHQHMGARSAATRAEIEAEIERIRKSLADHGEAYEKTVTDGEARQMFERMKTLDRTVMEVWGRLQPLSAAGKGSEAAEAYEKEGEPAAEAFDSEAEKLMNWNKRGGDEKTAAMLQAVVRADLWTWILLPGILLSGSLIAFFLTRSVNKGLTQAIVELSEGANQVASAAAEVSASSQILAQGASGQAASIEETSASAAEINSMARKNTANASVAAELMVQSQQQFALANQSLDETVAAMAEIAGQSMRISKIIKTIDEIAFQTNILALNAAVEAARAGEAGMGFAVVAEEVRNLAQRCAQAAKDTAAMIEESIAKSKDGQIRVDRVTAAIRAVTAEALRVKGLVDEVSTGSQEQARGIDEIGKAIGKMEQVTQSTAATAEKSAAAAEELSGQSETVREIAGRLSAMVGGVSR
ncbi:MAG: MCP four helix bundle domain-containing protein [Bryobacterales bacterium]|nr:MCP four helix bundle domain-containing protein [Bryobacterales bacterium]